MGDFFPCGIATTAFITFICSLCVPNGVGVGLDRFALSLCICSTTRETVNTVSYDKMKGFLMMKKYRLLACFLSAALLLSACQGKPEQPSDSETTAAETQGSTPPGAEDTAELSLVTDGKSDYVILVDFTDANANQLASFLQNAIFDKTGAMLPLRSADGVADYQKRILVGDLDTSASEELKSATVANSFSIASSSNTLAIYAKDVNGYLALESFVEDELLKEAQKKSWIVKNGYSYRHDPADSAEQMKFVTDGSVEYHLVYDSKDVKAWTQAIAYAKYLRETCGIKIKEGADTGKYANEILLGNVDRESVQQLRRYTQGEDAYFYGVYGGAYIIDSDNRLNLVIGAKKLADTLRMTPNVTIKSEQNQRGTISDFPQDRFYAEAVTLAKRIYGTHSSWVDYQITKMSQADQDDIKLVGQLITRMGESVAVCVGSSSALYNGFVVKLDSIDYSMVTKRTDEGHILVASEFFSTYFGKALTADADGYIDLTALCEQSEEHSLYYHDDLQIAIVTPKSVTAYGSADAEYLARMDVFFHNPLLPEPDVSVEQTRQEIIANEYDPAYIYDYTDTTYECYASPAILSVGNTLYISYDIMQMEFPNGVNTTMSGDTRFAKSTDGGKTWQEISTVKDLTYVALVELDGKIVLLGNRVSNGYVWVGIYDPATDVLEGNDLGFSVWGSAPTAVAVLDGRIYRAHNLSVISAPIDSDLLKGKNWTRTDDPNELLTKADYERVTGKKVTGNFMFEEGNVVQGKDGELYVLYRIDASPTYGYAAIFHLSKDGKVLTPVDSDKCVGRGFIEIPSNQSKFQIRYDEATGLYLSFVSITTGNSAHQRNVMALIASEDLFAWETVGVMLVEREMMNAQLSAYAHAFQYISFDFVGEDIVMLVREAVGNACNYHNSNAITMYTLSGYADYIQTKLAKN